MSAINTALMCAGGLLPAPSPRTRKMSTTTRLALMCIGLAPIPPTPFSRIEVLPPEPIRTLDPESGRKRAHVRRMEVVVELLRERGPLSRAQVAKELRKSHETALNWLCELREMGRVTAKRGGRYWIYEVAE